MPHAHLKTISAIPIRASTLVGADTRDTTTALHATTTTRVFNAAEVTRVASRLRLTQRIAVGENEWIRLLERAAMPIFLRGSQQLGPLMRTQVTNGVFVQRFAFHIYTEFRY